MVSKASDDLPEPDSPVITTSLWRGMSTSTFLRLCTRAPRTEIHSWAINEDWGALTRTQALWQSTIVARRCRKAQPELGIRDWGFGIRVEFGIADSGFGICLGRLTSRIRAIRSAVPSARTASPGCRADSRVARIPNPQ